MILCVLIAPCFPGGVRRRAGRDRWRTQYRLRVEELLQLFQLLQELVLPDHDDAVWDLHCDVLGL